jgi:hypothetical protein
MRRGGLAKEKSDMSAHPSVDRRESLDVDSTQTMRAIAPSELYDSQRPKSYAIQLVISDRPVNLDMMPRLEVFAAHRLYTLAAKLENGTWHALRLGFFPDEQSAEVVCGYLRTFFSSPAIVRVSTAEQERFAPTAAPRAAQPRPASVPVSAPTVRRQEPAEKPVKVAVSKMPAKRAKTLGEELLAEAREVQASRSGNKRAADQSKSWITRLFGRTNERPRPASRR